MVAFVSQYATVVFYTFILYFFVVFGLSVIGRRHTTELTIVDLIIIMVMGSAIETSLVGGDTSLVAGLVSAATLLASNRLLTWLTRRWDWLREHIIGHPIPLVYNGQVLERRLQQAGLSEQDVMEGIRERGYADLEQVRLAMLEMDGVISVIPIEDQEKRRS
jgi:uncharacterized membrane protein YcaP (DUF421 family)